MVLVAMGLIIVCDLNVEDTFNPSSTDFLCV